MKDWPICVNTFAWFQGFVPYEIYVYSINIEMATFAIWIIDNSALVDC